MTQHGTRLALALALLIAGLLFVRWIEKGLRAALRKIMPTSAFVPYFCNAVYFILVMIVVAAAATEFGAKPVNVIRFLSIVTLAVIGLVVFLRPFFPSMPFQKGNVIKTANLFGEVEAISFLNTRLRTLDGKTIFVPNRKIVDDIVINYHFTKTRRVDIDVGIQYDQDLLKAKAVLLELMQGDKRVRAEPKPVVYVLNLAASSVELQGRCWVDNEIYWPTRCALVEKAKLRFDREGIKFAFPQLELHHHPSSSGKTSV